MSGLWPSEPHHAAVEWLLEGYRSERRVRGALLCGSVPRGTARPDSDVDVLVVVESVPKISHRRTPCGPVAVEEVVRTYEGWIEGFSPSRIGEQLWGYAFLDGIPLYDPHGEVARLVTAAAEAHRLYRTPEHIRTHYRLVWEHQRPKLEALLHLGDAVEIGWAAAASTAQLTATLWAINDLPLPSRDIGAFQLHLDDLLLPVGAPQLVRDLLRAAPRVSLQLQVELIEMCLPYLESAKASAHVQ
jgi:hypothetical protein